MATYTVPDLFEFCVSFRKGIGRDLLSLVDSVLRVERVYAVVGLLCFTEL